MKFPLTRLSEFIALIIISICTSAGVFVLGMLLSVVMLYLATDVLIYQYWTIDWIIDLYLVTSVVTVPLFMYWSYKSCTKLEK